MTRHAVEPIRIGLMVPLTGMAAPYADELIHAAQIACAEINKLGGVHHRAIHICIADDGSSPLIAIPAARKLIEQGCVALIGNVLSNVRIAVADQVCTPLGIPLLNFASYEGSINSPYFFNFAALPNQQTEPMLRYMTTHFGHKMFFVGSNYEWPRGAIDTARYHLRDLGGDMVGKEYLPMNANDNDIDVLLERVAHAGADVLLPFFAGTELIRFLNRFHAWGLKRHMAVALSSFDEAIASRLSASVREGLFACNTYFMTLDNELNNHYLHQLSQQEDIDGLWPKGNGLLSHYGAGVHTCLHALAQTLSAAGTDPHALITQLEQVQLTTLHGELRMNSKLHHAHIDTYLARCQADGSFTILEQCGNIPPSIPKRYSNSNNNAAPASLTPQAAARLAAETIAILHAPEAAQQILSLADIAIIATDEHGIILDPNCHACAMFGYSEVELTGMSVHLLLPPHTRQQHAEFLQKICSSSKTQLSQNERYSIMGYRKDGSFFPIENTIARIRHKETGMLVMSIRDISERKQAEKELAWQSTHDKLTGLPNRTLIQERLANALFRSQQQGLDVVLLFVDIDGFKLINDTHGLQAGDFLLKTIANRLLEQVRPGDTVARLAGDEFVILCEQLEQPDLISLLAERINLTLRQSVEYCGVPMFVTASVGVAIGSNNLTAEELLHSADTAMYAVKEKGGDGWQFLSNALQEQARQRLVITNGLRLALERNELSPRFQPIVDAQTERIVGAELLLRWHPPEGEISPACFIPVAEMTGAIVSIGAWVFRQGCEAEVRWRKRWGVDAPYVSVNVSARQLNERHLIDNFACILYETGADPSRILLEITETSLMTDVNSNLLVLKRLAEFGMRVAVDDFGTGYSSLAQLTRMPVSVLKIDKAFVDDMVHKAESRTLICAVIGLGRTMRMKLLAEGVEDAGQLHELRNFGCDLIQGYFFHRPLLEANFIDIVDDNIKKTRA